MTLDPQEKVKMTWMHPEYLDTSADVEEIIIEQEQDAILYYTILICIILIIMIYFAW